MPKGIGQGDPLFSFLSIFKIPMDEYWLGGFKCKEDSFRNKALVLGGFKYK